MKKNIIVLMLTVVGLTISLNVLCRQSLTSIDAEVKTETQPEQKPESSDIPTKQEKTIAFRYDNEDLVDIINYLAAQKGVNVILPQGANAIAQKVNFFLEEKIPVNKAWQILYTILDVAGYSMMPKGNMYEIIKTSPTITKEPLPLYIGIQSDRLPDTDQRIRYIYYLANIKLSDDENSEVKIILNNILPTGTSSYKIDTTTNGLIIVAKSNDIKAVMKIIIELDKTEFQENLEVIPLLFTTAKDVADLFTENILKSAVDMNRYHLGAKQQTEVSFFSKHTRVIAEGRTNKLIILGRPQAIERVKDFIQKYIDIELESGKSILHVYQLLYADAEKLETVLNNIIKSAQVGGTEQTRVTGGVVGGAQKFFDEVKIKSDKPVGAEERKYYGGNKLVVAARNDDWKVIEKLIAELDTPQPQVLLEVLVADLTLEDVRALGAITRNPQNINLPGDTNVQAANLSDLTLSTNDRPVPADATIKADLLRLQYNESGARGSDFSLAHFMEPGSTVLSLNDADGKTWSVLRILKQFGNTKILSHPHVIATNNKKATVSIGEQRILQDESVGSGGTTTTIKKIKKDANLTIEITPRISSANTVHLEVKISVNDYRGTSSSTIITRLVSTNAVIKNKDIIALGGLIKSATTQDINETPVLSRIPIIGYFFKDRKNINAKTSLTVFISPTIIEPRLRSGVNDYTKDYIKLAKNQAHEGALFDSLKDPITRWFFKTDVDASDVIDEFMAKDEFKSDLQEKPVKKPNRRKKQTNKVAQISKPAPQPVPVNNKMHQLKELIAQGHNPLLGA